MSIAFLVCVAMVFVMAILGAPIALSMLVSAIIYLFIQGQDIGLVAEQTLQGLYGSYILLAIPLFIATANIMNAGAITDRLLKFCMAMVGRFRGGLGYVDILQSVLFAGMSGSSVADAAGMGKVIITMAIRSGKTTPGYAAAVTAASSTICAVLPPSIPLVMYALVSNASIGYLFLGGVIPGLIMAVCMVGVHTWRAQTRKYGVEEPTPLRELPGITLQALPTLLLPFILMAGIYGGAYTPTEAAAIAALYALILAIVYRALNLRSLYEILLDTGKQTAAVGLMVGAAFMFNYIIANENVPSVAANYFAQASVDPLTFLIIVNILILIAGMFLDASAIVLILIPIFIPAAKALGIDLVHFGVVAVVNAMIGLVTPPLGMVLFVVNAVTRVPLIDIVREIIPFLAALIISLFVMVIFPETVLWLPRLMGYEG